MTVRLRRIESDLELTVLDSGEGIAPDFLPHMFETFRQSDTTFTRPHGGLGIGLSIARHLVELHGGRIEGRSEGKGKGAAFVVRLPVSPLVSSTLGVKKLATKGAGSNRPAPPQLGGVRALVVEDDPDAQELLALVLRDSGIEVRTARSADEARHVLDSYEPHVIISDVGLPGENGHEFIRSIRTSPIEARRSIPALALTAFASNEDRTTALVAGFNKHLAKPVDAGTLVATIIELTGQLARKLSQATCNHFSARGQSGLRSYAEVTAGATPVGTGPRSDCAQARVERAASHGHARHRACESCASGGVVMSFQVSMFGAWGLVVACALAACSLDAAGGSVASDEKAEPSNGTAQGEGDEDAEDAEQPAPDPDTDGGAPPESEDDSSDPPPDEEPSDPPPADDDDEIEEPLADAGVPDEEPVDDDDNSGPGGGDDRDEDADEDADEQAEEGGLLDLP